LARAFFSNKPGINQPGPQSVDLSWNEEGSDNRLAAIFVIAEVGGKPARDLLLTALGQANAELARIEDGLKAAGDWPPR
jgi:hypothetical protein